MRELSHISRIQSLRPYSRNDGLNLAYARSISCLFLTQVFRKRQNDIIACENYHTFRIKVPSHVSGMCCVFAQNHESERDSSISASLSLSWFCAKTQRIPDTWDGTLMTLDLACEKYLFAVSF